MTQHITNFLFLLVYVESCDLNESSRILARKDSAGSSSQPKSGIGADPNKPPCKKAKLIRLERKQEKLRKKGLALETNIDAKNEQKSLEEFLNETSGESKHKFRVSSDIAILNTITVHVIYSIGLGD